ncbi:MAG TPA: 1,4-dihydroxy-2-naphthoate prenyltransferase [Coriobacteriia bacterium]|nr:1,4-dihydroxy-2-naphthoate prenyltransferase [Coriobacteriia bacterium]
MTADAGTKIVVPPSKGSQKQSLLFWVEAARKVALGQSLVPFIAGVLLAIKHPVAGEWWTWPLVILTLIGVACAHLGINLFDDYFDYKKGDVERRQNLIEGGMRARSKKCWYIDGGQATLAQTRRVALTFLVVASVIGIVATLLRGPMIPVIVAIALILGLEYSGPPFRFSYHGLGELVVGIMFGPLVLIGAYVVTAGSYAPVALWAAVPTGLLVVNIVYAHAIMDFESDSDASRITLAVLFKSKKLALVFLIVITALAYLCLVAALIVGALPLGTLATFITLPVAIVFCRNMWLYVYKPEVAVTPRWWMGPFENWDRYVAAGMDWFMIRWLSARNLLLFFLVALAVSYLLG